ncbi:MAG: RNA polymerase factor sigma-54 [bacterium]
MKPTIQLGLGQHLTMTPQLQQAIRLLQLSTLDLKQEIQEALDSNLMLTTEEELDADQGNTDQTEVQSVTETDYDAEIHAETDVIPTELPVDTQWEDQYDTPPPLPTPSDNYTESDFSSHQGTTQSLRDHLIWQMNLSQLNDTDRAIASAIIDSIDPQGYLKADLDDIGEAFDDPDIGIEEVTAVLHRVQQFDPAGVGARDLEECIRLQLQQMPADQPMRNEALTLMNGNFELLATGNEPGIRQLLKLDPDATREVIALIRSVNPYPGESVSPTPVEYVEPDVIVTRRNDRWVVELNPEITPRLRVNNQYAGLIRRADNSADNQVLKNHLQEAKWFIKSLHSRNDTLLRVASQIVEIQQSFFDYGEEAMRPLVLKEVAEALELHESTVSRVTSSKYMLTPRGTLEFKYFFSSQLSTDTGGATSATAIRALIKKMIAAEPAGKPLSDNKIATLLSDEGIKVARRTVAKYREAMAIPPSNERKRLI